MNSTDQLKRIAAEHAVDQILSGTVIGLGSGTTMRFVFEELGRRLADGRLQGIVGVPSSEQTTAIARDLAIPLGDLEQYPILDLAIDGADEIDPQLDLIKGRGGFLVREKIIATAARRLIIVADGSKLVKQLGSLAPLPVEVIPLAAPVILRRLSRLGPCRLRRNAAGELYRTDNCNYIIDYECGPLADPAALDLELLRMPGVVGHGLFLTMADLAVIADQQGVRMLHRPTPPAPRLL